MTQIPEDIMDAAEAIHINYVMPDPTEVRLAIAEAILSERNRVLSTLPIAGEGKVKIKNDPDNYLTVGKVQSKIANERNLAASSPGKDGGQEVEAVGCPGDKCEHFWEEAPCCNGWRPQPASTALVEKGGSDD